MAMGASLGPGAMNPQELTLEDDRAPMTTTITVRRPMSRPFP
jgi:hypothetical protein